MSVREFLAPPADWLGGVLPLELDCGVGENTAMFITHLTAYPTGFAFRMVAITRQDPGDICCEALERARTTGREVEELYLRFDVEFSDGRHAAGRGAWISTQGGLDSGNALPERLPPDPDRDMVLRPLSSGAQSQEYHQDCWVWPLPPPGSLSFYCGWPAAGLSVRQIEIDAAVLHEAAERAKPIWPARGK